MRTRTHLVPTILLLFGCSGSAPEQASKAVMDVDLQAVEAEAAQATTGEAMDPAVVANGLAQEPVPDADMAISSSAAREPGDSSRHFIRAADLRFRVQDVVKATLGIEDIVGAQRGWVARTELRSNEQRRELIPVSADSILEVTTLELVNRMILRVPNTALDSTLRAIGRWVDVFDHRIITADDIGLRMMANSLAVRRARSHAQRVSGAIDDHGRKLKETIAAEEALRSSEEQRDDGILRNLELADRVAYSTVTLDLYQRPVIRRALIPDVRSIEGYRPPLWSRIGDGLRAGWRGLEWVLTALASIWPLLLLLGAGFWLTRRRGRPRGGARPAA
jgi:hypothetical protein